MDYPIFAGGYRKAFVIMNILIPYPTKCIICKKNLLYSENNKHFICLHQVGYEEHWTCVIPNGENRVGILATDLRIVWRPDNGDVY